jgi:hypothetical protein
MTPDERFWSKVRKVGECWLWTAGCFDDGYGAFGYKGKLWRAHRWCYWRTKGEIPIGMVVMHSCDTPRCVRPEHLSVGTYSDNAADAASKGRNIWQRHPEKVHRRKQNGEDNASAKLNWSNVARIRQMYAEGRKQREIAEFFKVTQSAISNVLTGKRWTKQ